MAVSQSQTTTRVTRPPRAVAWVLLLASAVAVMVVGLLATSLVFGNLGSWPVPDRMFWLRLLFACALTIISLTLRSLRWIFLLRRAETRIPIRDAYIGYLAGLSLLVTPLFLGEIAVRAAINRSRRGVPVLTTAVVNVWERALDLVALMLIAGVAAVAAGRAGMWKYVLIGGAATTLVSPARRVVLRATTAVLERFTCAFEPTPAHTFDRLAAQHTWLAMLATSVVAWLLPGLGLWLLAGASGAGFGILDAERAYAASAAVGGVALTPGGVLVAGRQLLAALGASGIVESSAALVVLGVRLATTGLSMALGIVFVLLHFWRAGAASATHFDDIADAYDVQIPESRRHALLDRKTGLMREIITAEHCGPRGLDVGCGQGAYISRMRQLGCDVVGIDSSAGQVRLAAHNVGQEGLVQVGSVLAIPARDASFDFLYIINVLHHLASLDEQRRAFAELFRVLEPGGLLFVHEINTRNILFRFYMGYVFPSLNCIDEGVERWLLPHRFAQYTRSPVIDVRYFTFLPDFVPGLIVRALTPVERLLESSRLRVYSAHYMAVLRKDSGARP